MEDYLTKSPFGQVAGSLLSRRDSDYKKALGISLFGSVLQEMNLSKQADMQQNIQKTQYEFDQIFSNNDEIWEANQSERDLYNRYSRASRQGEEEGNIFLDNEAIKRFNDDEHNKSLLGTNPYSKLMGGDLNTESRRAGESFYNQIRESLVDELEMLKGDKSITSSTQTKFNQAAVNELNAQLSVYQDDPAKQSVILNTFGNIFGIYDRKRAELSLSLQNAQRVRREQEATYTGVSFNEDKQRVVEQVTQGRNRTNMFPYTTSSVETARAMEAVENRLKAKSEAGQPFTEDDIIEAFGYGIDLLDVPNLANLIRSDIPLFTETFNFVNAYKKRFPDEDPTNYLDPRQKSVYYTAMGIEDDNNIDTRAAMNDTRSRAEVAQLIQGIVAGEPEDILELIESEDEKDQVSLSLLRLDGDFNLDDDGIEDRSTHASNAFISNVLRAKAILEGEYNVSSDKSLMVAFNMQLNGIMKEESSVKERLTPTTYTRFDDENNPEYYSSLSKYVDPDVLTLEVMPETAFMHAENYNNLEWLQQNSEYFDTEGRKQNFVPEQGKVVLLSEDTDDFQVILKTVPDLRFGENEESFKGNVPYKWVVYDPQRGEEIIQRQLETNQPSDAERIATQEIIRVGLNPEDTDLKDTPEVPTEGTSDKAPSWYENYVDLSRIQGKPRSELFRPTPEMIERTEKAARYVEESDRLFAEITGAGTSELRDLPIIQQFLEARKFQVEILPAIAKIAEEKDITLSEAMKIYNETTLPAIPSEAVLGQ